ncbi:MAG: hypothetical protein ACLR8Y_02410 [Alistipes indistinctus]
MASATEDLGADPRGEFLAAAHAGEVYALYGYRGWIPLRCLRPIDRWTPRGLPPAYRQHDVTAWDWAQYIPFVKREV